MLSKVNKIMHAEAVEALLEEPELPKNMTVQLLPPGVIAPLDQAIHPRKGSWHSLCIICAKPFKANELIRAVLYSDGSRPFVHESHLQSAPDAVPEACKHGIVPSTACTYCKHGENFAYPKSRSFRAKTEGECIACQKPFGPGTLIQKLACAKGTGWGHASHAHR